MNLLTKAKKKAKQLGIDGELSLSDRKGKKLKMITPKGKTVHFGSDTSNTFLEGATEQKRNAYQARASKIKNKDGKYTYKIPYTANYLSYNILW